MNSRGRSPRIGTSKFNTTLKGLNDVGTYTQILYHVVFATKNRTPALTADRREELFKYLWGIFKNKHCHLYRVNGVEDHVHVLFALHPMIALSTLVKDVKVASSLWIKEKHIFPHFAGWQDGYSAFTHSLDDRDRLIDYIKRQEEHHRRFTFREELEALLKEAGVAFDPAYLEV